MKFVLTKFDDSFSKIFQLLK